MVKKSTAVVPLCFITSLFSAGLYFGAPHLPIFAQSLGVSYLMIGLISGAYGFSQMIVRIPLGIYSDLKDNRRGIIGIGLILLIISSLVVWISPAVWSLFFMRIGMGLSAATWIVYTVLFTTYFLGGRTSRAMGIINAFFAAGQLTVMVLSGILVPLIGIRSLFGLSAAVAGLGFILNFFVYEEKGEVKDRPTVSDLLSGILNKRLFFVSFAGTLTQIITFGLSFTFVPLIAKEMGASDFKIGLLSSLAIAPGLFLPVLSGSFLVKYFSEEKIIAVGFFLSTLFSLSLFFVNSTNSLMILQFFGGFSRGLIFPLLMGMSIHGIDTKYRATSMGVFQSIYGIGMFLGPVIMGLLADRGGIHSVLWFSAIVGVVGSLFSVIFLKVKKGVNQ